MEIKSPLNFKYPLNCIESVIATQTKRHGSHNSNAYVIVYYRNTFFAGVCFSRSGNPRKIEPRVSYIPSITK